MMRLFSDSLYKFFLLFIVILFSISILTGCSVVPPKNPKNLCDIFSQYPNWYDDALEVYEERGVPVNISMAFMYQESGYKHDAKPPMRWFLFIPYGRGSSSYGYAQAQDPVWDDYTSENNKWFVSRDNFKDSLDFISWYILKTHKINHIPITDVYNQYLNYHEGWGGYKRGSYKNNKTLKNIATNVKNLSNKYASQLRNCKL